MLFSLEDTVIIMDDWINHMSSSELKSINDWARFWYHTIGVNTIPADTEKKKPMFTWKQFQNNPVSEECFQGWLDNNAFKNGMAIIPGRVWHRPDRQNLYLIFIDFDKQRGIDEVLTREDGLTLALKQAAEKWIIEQHKGNVHKAHAYFYSPIPFPNKGPDQRLGIEIKGQGERGIAFCTPSVHQDKTPFEIIGTREPQILTELAARDLMQHLNQVCLKHGLQYLEKASNLSNQIKRMINALKLDSKVRIPKGKRHITLISIADSLLLKHLGKKSEETLHNFLEKVNNTLCDPEPLPNFELNNNIWKSALAFVTKVREHQKGNKVEQENENGWVKHGRSWTEQIDNASTTKKKKSSIVKAITEDILNRYRFITIEESKEILVYENGVYVQGGEVLIEKVAESMYGFKVANRHLAEVKGHIMRITYHKHEELDSDINIINLKNGLYDIKTGQLREHTPTFLSIAQRPILYNSSAKPKNFVKYLQKVLYPAEIRTAIELMAYTFHKDNPFEIIAKLFGYGANGKSVFTGLLTALHGTKNISNVPLSSMLKNRFALSDLENRYVNIDTELSSTTIHDTTVLKKLTGRQPVRVERKNQRAYDATIFAKLFFSANKIPETEDESDAYFRREVIISFPNRFEDGKGADPDMLRKMTTKEELSGIFNVLVTALRNLLKNKGIFVREKTIEQRRERHELAVNPIGYFLKDAIAEESIESDRTDKDIFYHAYKHFCSQYALAVESRENLGKILKSNRFGYQDERESSGKRRRYWKGIKLAAKYSIVAEQQTLI